MNYWVVVVHLLGDQQVNYHKTAAAGERTISEIASDRVHVAYIMPRQHHDDVRTVYKEALAIRQLGYDVTLICKQASVNRYLGMRVTEGHCRAQGLFRPFLNTPRLLRQALSLEADIYVLVNPDTLLLAILLYLSGKRIVYSTHEDFMEKVKIHPVIPRCLQSVFGMSIVAVEHIIARLASAMIVTQPDVQERYAPHAILARNAPLIDGPVCREADRLGSLLPAERYPTLIYAGAITMNRGLIRMLDIIAALNASRPWILKLVGHVDSEKTLAAARSHPAWPHVKFLGHVSHELALAHIRKADMGLALLKDVGGYSRASITKLYEYMLLETPFVASDFSAWRDSIDDVPAGLFVNDDDPESIAAQISAVFEDRERFRAMQREGRAFIETRFNWTLESRLMLEAIGSILDPVPSRAL